ncbi:MAG TPA: hypothetical protein VHM90_17670, partial [Phycisphaerae bacterium]|nr:hypothetical protein [Phycisphaerae bacterium]
GSIVPAASEKTEPFTLDPAEWLALLTRGDHRTLTQRIIRCVEVSSKMVVLSQDALAQQQYDNIANLLLFVITHPAYQVPGEMAEAFIRLNHALSSHVACSHFKTTDAHLEVLRHQQGNFVKILALYSARNSVAFDSREFFRLEPRLASVWYLQYGQLAYSGVSSEVIRQRLAGHFNQPPEQLVPVTDVQDAYFGPTYVDQTCERAVKACVNRRICATHPVTISSEPNAAGKPKIAVVTRNWQKNHSVYRICSQLIASLRPHYHLTLVQCGERKETLREAFDEVLTLPARGAIGDLTPLFRNEFHAAIYPDVGMSDESIYLANLRLAPVQIAMPGHPVSTFGSQMDYFITGADVEAGGAERHYSERLVLLPGMGCVHNRPLWTPAPRPAVAGGKVHINVPAFGQKLNAGFLRTLAEIERQARRAGRGVFFRLFVGSVIFVFNDYVAFKEQLAEILPAEAFEIVVTLPYDEYMARMADGHFSVDAWHFGGGNSVSDSLFAGVPMICREGDRWYNRIGAQMLRRAGFPELVVRSEEGLVGCAMRMIVDDGWCGELRHKLLSADLSGTLYAAADARYFRKAVDFVLANHVELKHEGGREAIRIPRDSLEP